MNETAQVCIGLPSYKQTNPQTAFSIMAQLDRTKTALLLQFGDAFIVHARNRIADRFLKTGAEWLLTVDDDMILPCGKAEWFNDATKFNLPKEFAERRVIPRLLSHKKTLVGALYYSRWESLRPVYNDGATDAAWLKAAPRDACKPTKWVGTGCLMVHRSVFLDIEKTFPKLARKADGTGGQWFTSSEHDLVESVDDALHVLEDATVRPEVRLEKALTLLRNGNAKASHNSGLSMGEDVQFCLRAAQAGHQAYVDCGLVCGHVGHHVYGNRYK